MTDQTQNLRLDPELPTWVSLTHCPEPPTLDQSVGGVTYLLDANQISLIHGASFTQKIFRLESILGVQNASDVKVFFNPEYEKIVFHSLKITRGGQPFEKSNISKISVRRVEQEHERFIYNGMCMALFHFEEVRVGDTLSVSYSIQGSNPLLDDRGGYLFQVGFQIFVQKVFRRVIAHPNTKLFEKSINGAPPFTIETTPTQTIYQLDLSPCRSITIDPDSPFDYLPMPIAVLSRASTWKELSQWGAGLFPKVELSPAICDFINSEKEKNTQPEDIILSVITFVQNTLRYLSASYGTHNLKPYPPDEVFARGYGDCKDKVYLCYVILLHMGFRAQPVLVNGNLRSLLTEILPIPQLFDHVTLRVEIASVWRYFDLTSSFQGGNTHTRPFPDFKFGLPLDPSGEDLSPIPFTPQSQIEVKESFRLLGVPGPVDLTSVTVYKGTEAERMRRLFASNSKTEISKHFISSYSNLFGEVQTLKPLSFFDNDFENKVTIEENYHFAKPWRDTPPENPEKQIFAMQGTLLQPFFQFPSVRNRTTPLQISYPLHLSHEITIHLPKDDTRWALPPAEKKLETPFFKFDHRFLFDSQIITFQNSVQTFTHSVPANLVGSYLTQIDDLHPLVFQHLQKPISKKRWWHNLQLSLPLPVRIILIVLGGTLALAGLVSGHPATILPGIILIVSVLNRSNR